MSQKTIKKGKLPMVDEIRSRQLIDETAWRTRKAVERAVIRRYGRFFFLAGMVVGILLTGATAAIWLL